MAEPSARGGPRLGQRLRNNTGMPILTIVISTRNRASTAMESIATALAVEGDGLEVVVHDCGDGEELQSQLSSRPADPRLVYRRVAPVSMVENWRMALECATREYVCVIGDDDGIANNVVPAMRWARVLGFEAVVDSRASYYWPDYPLHRAAGRLGIPDVRGGFEVLDAEREMDRCIGRPFIDIVRLPRLYHGFIRRDLLLRLREKTGCLLPSTAPDYYSAVALASLQPRYCLLDFLILVSGAPGLPNTGRDARSPKTLVAHMIEYGGAAWPEILPRCTSSSMIVGEAMVTAAEATNRPDLLRRLNWPAILGIALRENPSQVREFIRCVSKLADRSGLSLAPLASGMLAHMVRYSYRRLRLKAGNRPPLRSLPGPRAEGLMEAVALVQQHLRDKGTSPPWPTESHSP